MFKLQVANLPRVFQSLPDSDVATQGITKPEPPTTPVVELEE